RYHHRHSLAKALSANATNSSATNHTNSSLALPPPPPSAPPLPDPPGGFWWGATAQAPPDDTMITCPNPSLRPTAQYYRMVPIPSTISSGWPTTPTQIGPPRLTRFRMWSGGVPSVGLGEALVLNEMPDCSRSRSPAADGSDASVAVPQPSASESPIETPC